MIERETRLLEDARVRQFEFELPIVKLRVEGIRNQKGDFNNNGSVPIVVKRKE